MKHISKKIRISVKWGYELHSIEVPERRWKKIQKGEKVRIRGKGYRYEGEFFWDYWAFNYAEAGSLLVGYGNDGAEGFVGTLSGASIEDPAL